MKKNEIIEIGKEEFTLCKYFNPYVRCMDLYDAYMKPSQMKKIFGNIGEIGSMKIKKVLMILSQLVHTIYTNSKLLEE